MTPRDLVYVGHMLDTARKAVAKPRGLSREEYDSDEDIVLAGGHQGPSEARRGARTSGPAWLLAWAPNGLPQSVKSPENAVSLAERPVSWSREKRR